MQSPSIAIESPVLQTAILRSYVYAFLCRALAYPSPEHRSALGEEILPAMSGFELDDEVVAAVRQSRAFIEAPLDVSRAVHTSVFTLTVSADCPDYETAYDSHDIFQQTQTMADVGGFYRAHGLEVGGIEQERPDHIATELEFMSFLASKEAHAIENFSDAEVDVTRESQALFLRDHLGCWGPEFGRRVEARAGLEAPFYAAAGRALSSWLEDECEFFDIAPTSKLLASPLQWPEPDDGVCGSAGECPLIGLEQIQVER
ncbi:MAG: molecular chaperone TorD family protein [Anaerolineaceae bacterium]